MTYLEIVNNVLKRLREREVSTVNENAYSALIGILVNDAKTEIQHAWSWSADRTTLTAATTANLYSYSLTGAASNFQMLHVFNDTDNWFLEQMDSKELTGKMLDNPQTGSPMYYSYNGVDTNGDTMVDLYPIPDAAYNIRFNLVKRAADFSADADEIYLPDLPIIMLTYAKAIEERGEDAGVASSSAYAIAQKHLSDYISLDAAKHPEELEWYTA